MASYVYGAGDGALSAGVVDEAFTHSLDGWLASVKIDEAAESQGVNLDAPLQRELRMLAVYPLSVDFHGRPGCTLEAARDVNGLEWWVPINQVSDDVLHLWADLASAVTVAAAKARLHDLLFLRKDGEIALHASSAIAGYVGSVSEGDFEPDLEDMTALLRAWTLSRLVGDHAANHDVRLKLVDFSERVLDGSPGRHPGVLMPMLNALTEGPSKTKPPTAESVEVLALLERAAELYNQPNIASEIAGYRRRLVDPSDYEQVNRDEVAAYMATAEQAPHAAAQMHWYEQASRLAAQRGLTDLSKLAAARMQRIRPEDLGLIPIRSTSAIEPHHVDWMVRPYTRSADWRDGLRFFVMGDVPTGTTDWLKEVRDESPSVLRDLLPSTILTGEGLPRATATEGDAKDADAKSLPARIAAENAGSRMSTGLVRMATKYGIPTEDDLTSFFVQTLHAEPLLARSMAKSFRHFWAGDYESAVHIAVPRIEGTARNLLRELDAGIYKVQAGASPGGYPFLHALIAELEKIGLDESWAYFLKWLLLGPYGANLRNDVAHGFVYSLDPAYAALVLRAMCLLALMTTGELGSLDEEAQWAEQRKQVEARIRSPYGQRGSLEHIVGFALGSTERVWWALKGTQERLRHRRLAQTQDTIESVAAADRGVSDVDLGEKGPDDPAGSDF